MGERMRHPKRLEDALPQEIGERHFRDALDQQREQAGRVAGGTGAGGEIHRVARREQLQHIAIAHLDGLAVGDQVFVVDEPRRVIQKVADRHARRGGRARATAPARAGRSSAGRRAPAA
jgi:hypothetical protein